MEILWLILAVVCAIVGIVGSVLPVLPGPPISYITLWMIWLYDSEKMPIWLLIFWGILMIIVTVIDYIAPIWLTKIGGGTRYGEIGATIGVIAGLFFMPEGLIIGPFVGAFIGELLAKTPFLKALKVAFMSLLAFLLATGFKLIYGIMIPITVILCLIFC